MAKEFKITLQIKRYDPEEKRSWLQAYNLEAGRIQRFVDLFRQINDEQDPTLAWNSSCEHGQCGTCSVKVNGKPLLACELLVENAVQYFQTRAFTIEPLNVAPVVRDLVIDLTSAYERIDRIEPYIIRPGPRPSEQDAYPIMPQRLDPSIVFAVPQPVSAVTIVFWAQMRCWQVSCGSWTPVNRKKPDE